MHAGPLITTPSALLLSSLSPPSSFSLIPCSILLSPLSLPAPPVDVYLCLFSFLLSPTLLLTSSAVLRPLHEANAHSGLAVAACMRSTGGPIKRRQEQEMELEAGRARPQGPHRYHHCPPPYVSATVPVSVSPPTPVLPPPPPAPVCPQTHLRTPCVCVLWVLAVLKYTSTPSCVCLQFCLPKNPRNPFFLSPSTAPSHPAVCLCMCVCVFVCVCS